MAWVPPPLLHRFSLLNFRGFSSPQELQMLPSKLKMIPTLTATPQHQKVLFLLAGSNFYVKMLEQAQSTSLSRQESVLQKQDRCKKTKVVTALNEKSQYHFSKTRLKDAASQQEQVSE